MPKFVLQTFSCFFSFKLLLRLITFSFHSIINNPLVRTSIIPKINISTDYFHS